MKVLHHIRAVAIVVAGAFALAEPKTASASTGGATFGCGTTYCSDSCWTLFWQCADTCTTGNSACGGSCTGTNGHTYGHSMKCGGGEMT
jgi:hypothetical protein